MHLGVRHAVVLLHHSVLWCVALATVIGTRVQRRFK